MQLVINKQEYYIPAKWNEVTLRQYQKFMATHNKDASASEQELHLISCFTGVSPAIIGKAKKSQITKVVNRLALLIEEKPSEELIMEFEINGTEYGFHPNLQELKLKEFVDLDNALSDGWKNMHKIMSILYRPIVSRKGSKYEIEEYDYTSAKSRAIQFLDGLSVEIVNGGAAFFLLIVREYIQIMQVYSKLDRTKKRQHIRQTKKLLRKTMGGTR